MKGAPKQPSRIGLTILLVVAFVVCVAFLMLNPQLTGASSAMSSTTNIDLSEGWTTAGGKPVLLGSLESLPEFYEEGAIVQHKLPKDLESGTSLNFISKNVTVIVRIDGLMVYGHNPNTAIHGMSYGQHFNSVPLTTKTAGKIITLQLKPVYTDSACRLDEMRISSSITYVQHFVNKHLISFMMSLVVVFVGVAVIVLQLALREVRQDSLDLLSLGAISILLGIWSASETLIPQLITGYYPLIRALDYMSLLFAAYPLARFAGSLIQPPHRERYDRLALGLTAGALNLMVLLAVVCGKDMHELLIISHLLIVASVLIVVAEVVASVRERGGIKQELVDKNRTIIIAFLFFLACGVLDFVIYRASGRGTMDSAFLLRWGLFVFSLVLGVEALHATVDNLIRANRAEAIEALAYQDALTGIGNRAAWQAMCGEVNEAVANTMVDDVMVCQIDVNFLKRVNDTLGHAAGDDHLKRAADTINRSFGTEGTCYRTGGDEFTVIIVGALLDDRLAQCTDLFYVSMAEQREMCGHGETPLSMALGAARASETEKGTVEAAQLLADVRMYENKRAMKAERDG